MGRKNNIDSSGVVASWINLRCNRTTHRYHAAQEPLDQSVSFQILDNTDCRESAPICTLLLQPKIDDCILSYFQKSLLLISLSFYVNIVKVVAILPIGEIKLFSSKLVYCTPTSTVIGWLIVIKKILAIRVSLQTILTQSSTESYSGWWQK